MEQASIILTAHGETHSTLFDEDSTLDDVVIKLRGLLVLYGFNKDAIFDRIKTMEEIEQPIK